MNAERFDAFSRFFARRVSRRSTLAAAAALAMGAGAALPAPDARARPVGGGGTASCRCSCISIGGGPMECKKIGAPESRTVRCLDRRGRRIDKETCCQMSCDGKKSPFPPLPGSVIA